LLSFFTVIPDESTMTLTGLDRHHELRQNDKVQIRCSAGCTFPNASFVFHYVVSNYQTLRFKIHQLYIQYQTNNV